MGNDLRQAVRGLARRPGLSLAVLLILALGIGSTTAIFSIASSVLLSEVPFPEADRLVALGTLMEREGGVFPISYQDAGSWREASRTLELVSLSSGTQLNLTAGDVPERIGVGFVSASYFDLLGWRPVLGRTFLPEDEDPHSPPQVAVLTDGLPAVEAACAEAISHGVHSADVVLNILNNITCVYTDAAGVSRRTQLAQVIPHLRAFGRGR